MSVFVMADTHLSLSLPKPMDIFGKRWENYVQKIEDNWHKFITDTDTVIIPGDVSWGINFEEAKADLLFLDRLPGKKILLKGNHDFWWETTAKMQRFIEDNHIQTISFLHNNAYLAENFIICGSRGWYNEDKKVIAQNVVDSEKILNRELCRLRLSLEAGKKLQAANSCGDTVPEILAFLHFPPYFKGYICDEIILELYRYNIRRCFFGHIHGVYEIPMRSDYMDIDFHLISADYLNFIPYRIAPQENFSESANST